MTSLLSVPENITFEKAIALTQKNHVRDGNRPAIRN